MEACKTEQYRAERSFLVDLVVGMAIRIVIQIKRQTCAACHDNVDASNQEAHYCMTEQHVLCERALDRVTIDQLASVLASNKLGRPTIEMAQIIGDDRDKMIQCVVHQAVTPSANAMIENHATINHLLFQIHPQPSTWNSTGPAQPPLQ